MLSIRKILNADSLENVEECIEEHVRGREMGSSSAGAGGPTVDLTKRLKPVAGIKPILRPEDSCTSFSDYEKENHRLSALSDYACMELAEVLGNFNKKSH